MSWNGRIFFQVTVGPIFTLGASISDIHIVHLGFVCFLIKIIKKILVQITMQALCAQDIGGKILYYSSWWCCFPYKFSDCTWNCFHNSLYLNTTMVVVKAGRGLYSNCFFLEMLYQGLIGNIFVGSMTKG